LGFSKIVSNLESLQNNRVGTPMYLSPEMIKLKPYDFKVIFKYFKNKKLIFFLKRLMFGD